MVWPLFPPSVRSGGPARTAEAILTSLGAEFDFSVITSAYDFASSKEMPEVRSDHWCEIFGAKVWYMSERRPPPFRLLQLIRSRDPQLVCLNSLWNARFSIFPLLTILASRMEVPVLLSPHGELSPGALRTRPWRKRFVICAYRALRINRRVSWHASTEMERADIRRVFGPTVRCRVAVNLRSDLAPAQRLARKTPEPLAPIRAVFLSRITPKKNLDGLLRALSLVQTDIELTIAGPIDEPSHWSVCRQLIEALPENAVARIHGPVAPAKVVDFLGGFDLFLLPTHGENFGHVILEALAAGLPVIVGSDTPWQQAEAEHAGWLVNSDSPPELARLIDRFATLTPAERAVMSESATRLAAKVLGRSEGVEAHRQMFLELAQGERPR